MTKLYKNTKEYLQISADPRLTLRGYWDRQYKHYGKC